MGNLDFPGLYGFPFHAGEIDLEISISEVLSFYKVQKKQMDIYIQEAKIEMGNCDNEEDYDNLYRVYKFIKNIEGPRFFLHGAVLYAWSSYESIMNNIAKKIALKVCPDKKIVPKDLKGSMLNRIFKFFELQLCVDDIPSYEDKQLLKNLYTIRCAIAHENGFVSLLNEKTINDLKIIDANGDKIMFENDYFILSADYVEYIITEMHRILLCTYSRYRFEYV